MAKLVKMKAGQGADEANVAGKSYRVDPNGEILVPSEAVQTLVGVAGFTVVNDPVELPEGLVYVRHPDPNAFLGEDSADEHGLFAVRAHEVAGLLNHGFVGAEAPRRI